MKLLPVRHNESNAGFSLVEVALALLVVAIGFSAVFGLFPAGLQASRTAIEETEIAEFAEFVFETLEVIARERWSDLNTDGLNGLNNRQIVSTRIMVSPPPPEQRIRTTDPQATYNGLPAAPPPLVTPNLFQWRLAPTVATGVLTDAPVSEMTYFLQITDLDGRYPPRDDIRLARLQVWPGARDQAITASGLGKDFPGGILFYREYSKQKD